jgi:FMN-dependent NADH-azoreductase
LDTERKECVYAPAQHSEFSSRREICVHRCDQAFLDAYEALYPDATIDTLNVWDENLPDFDQEAIGAKYKGVNKEPMDQTETEAINSKIPKDE